MLNYTRKGKEIRLMSLCKTFYFLIKIFKWRIDLRQFFIFFPIISNLWWLFLSSQTFMLKMQNEKTFMGVSCFYIWWCTSHVKKIITNTFFFFFIYIYIKYNAIKFKMQKALLNIEISPLILKPLYDWENFVKHVYKYFMKRLDM